MLAEGQAARLLRYPARVPEPQLLASPWPCVSFAWAALMAINQELVLPMLSRAAAALSDPHTLSPFSRQNAQRIKGHLLSIQSFVARAQGDILRATRLAEQANRKLPGDDPGDRVAHAVTLLNLAARYQESGEIAKEVPFLGELRKAGHAEGFSYAALTAQASLAEIEMQLSRLDRAARICDEAITDGTRRGGAGNAQVLGARSQGLSLNGRPCTGARGLRCRQGMAPPRRRSRPMGLSASDSIRD